MAAEVLACLEVNGVMAGIPTVRETASAPRWVRECIADAACGVPGDRWRRLMVWMALRGVVERGEHPSAMPERLAAAVLPVHLADWLDAFAELRMALCDEALGERESLAEVMRAGLRAEAESVARAVWLVLSRAVARWGSVA